MIYQHEAHGANNAITSAIDTHVQAERARHGDDENGAGRCAGPGWLMVRLQVMALNW